MESSTQQRLKELVEQLRQDPGLPERLPSAEGAIVRAAMEGRTTHEIASDAGAAESHIWQVLSSAARQASGQKVEQVEAGGGLGGDPDPGVSGGYGAAESGAGGQTGGASGTGGGQHQPADRSPRPSQAEGEDRPGQAPGVQPPRPSQAEGELEDIEESLRRKERGG